MNESIVQALEELRGAWRFRWIGLATAFAAALIGWAIVFSLPDRYEAYARVFVDTRTALRPALQGLTVEQNVDSEINYVRQSLLTGPQLEKIARESGVLPANVLDERETARVLDKLSNRISLTVSTAGSAGDDRGVAGTLYNFDYVDADRVRSLRVIDNLLNTFVERTLGGKREGSENAQKFLATQIKDYEQRLSLAEDKLAAFKKKNIGLMPTDQGGFFANMQTEVEAEKKAETNLAIAVSRREELSKQLHGDAAVSAAGTSGSLISGQGVTSGSDTLTRIQETQAKLDELLLKYTDKHPDVIATRATLAELKQRRAAELESLRHGDAAAVAASGAGSNPVYQSIQLELNKQDVEIAALRREVAQHQETVAQLRQQLNSAPEIEAEYQQLNRDYDVNKAEYSALLENYQKARIGEKADNAGSVRFEIVLPPTAHIGPVWPKRTLSLFGVLIFAMGAGAAVAYFLNTLRPIVQSAPALAKISGFPVLGSVGVAFPTQYRAATLRDLRRFSAGTACLLLAFALALVLNWSGVRFTLQAIQSLVKT
jgi:polysaccharide chain length determinant protein (PEP-CTERM system associated)